MAGHRCTEILCNLPKKVTQCHPRTDGSKSHAFSELFTNAKDCKQILGLQTTNIIRDKLMFKKEPWRQLQVRRNDKSGAGEVVLAFCYGEKMHPD